MDAKEMFKALGYEQIDNDGERILYVKESPDRMKDRYIIFVIKFKECRFVEAPFLYDFEPSKEELEASNQQMKELGWL